MKRFTSDQRTLESIRQILSDREYFEKLRDLSPLCWYQSGTYKWALTKFLTSVTAHCRSGVVQGGFPTMCWPGSPFPGFLPPGAFLVFHPFRSLEDTTHLWIPLTRSSTHCLLFTFALIPAPVPFSEAIPPVPEVHRLGVPSTTRTRPYLPSVPLFISFSIPSSSDPVRLPLL